MLKRILMLSVVMLWFFEAKSVYSQTLITEDFASYDKRFATGVNVSAVIPGSNKFDTGFYVGGTCSYDLLRFLAIGVEAGYAQCGLKSEGTDLGDLRCAPIMGDVILKAPLDFYDFVLTPYAIGGFGVLVSDVEESGNIYNNGKIDTNTPFMFKFGGGVDVTFNEMIVLNIEASYAYARITFTEKLTGQSFGLGNTDFGCGYVGGGLKIKF